MRIDYAKLSIPNEEAFQELLASCREQRKLREAFQPSLRQRERQKQFQNEQWEQHMGEMGYDK